MENEKITVQVNGTRKELGRIGAQILTLFADQSFEQTLEWLTDIAEWDNDTEFSTIETVEELRDYIDRGDPIILFDIAMEISKEFDIYAPAYHPDENYTKSQVQKYYELARNRSDKTDQNIYYCGDCDTALASCDPLPRLTLFIMPGITREKIELSKIEIRETIPRARFDLIRVDSCGVPV